MSLRLSRRGHKEDVEQKPEECLLRVNRKSEKK
jgi:hypothetical protein